MLQATIPSFDKNLLFLVAQVYENGDSRRNWRSVSSTLKCPFLFPPSIRFRDRCEKTTLENLNIVVYISIQIVKDHAMLKRLVEIKKLERKSRRPSYQMSAKKRPAVVVSLTVYHHIE